MTGFLTTANAFIEDTCVIIVIAHLLTRMGPLAALSQVRLSQWRMWQLGILFGVIGLSEPLFPGARFPYVMHTLVATYASLVGGLLVGLIVMGIVTIGAVFLHPTTALGAAVAVTFSTLVGASMWRLNRGRHFLMAGLASGTIVQAGLTFLCVLLPMSAQARLYLPHAISSIAANGFGVLLLQLVVRDAHARAAGERHRMEAEQSRALLAEAQISALRSRIRPHFLFNALTSIASLCSIDPARAETSIIRLAELMRRSLRSDARKTVPLDDELNSVRSYLWIEQQRLGQRLRVEWDVDPSLGSVRVPPFAVQILVENAVNHGVASQPEFGTVRISARSLPGKALVAVSDDGSGMSEEAKKDALSVAPPSTHGLPILNQQLLLLYGRRARLRLFSRSDAGTLAVFAVPAVDGLISIGVRQNAERANSRR